MAEVKIFVGNLAYSVREAKLREMFAKHGTVNSAEVVLDGSKKSKGFAFVAMPEADAEKAIAALNGVEVEGRAITVERAREHGAPAEEGEKKYSIIDFVVPQLADQIEENLWRVSADAKVVEKVGKRNRYPQGNVKVVFSWGENGGGEEDTDQKGLAHLDILLDEPGTYIVWAEVEGQPDTRRRQVTRALKKPAEEITRDKAEFRAKTAEAEARVREAEEKGKPKPAAVKEIVLQHSGKPGDYEVYFQVVAENGPAGKRKVQITGSSLANLIEEDTDENGAGSFDAQFQSFEARYRITDLKSGVYKDVRLFGLP